MKVLHVIQRYAPAVGGSETWCREVCQHLAAAGDQMTVLTFDVIEEEEFWQDPPPDRCTVRLGHLDWDGRVLVKRYRRSLPVYAFYHTVLKVVLDRWLGVYMYGPHSMEMYGRLLAEVRAADVVYLHTMPYPHNFFAYAAARLCGKPVVITPHFHPDHPHYERRSNYWLLRRADAVIVISEYEKEYLAARGVDAGKIVATGTGVHLDEYRAADVDEFGARLRAAHGWSEQTRLILFLGRKLEYKGIGTLVEAFRRLPAGLDAALLLAGPSTAWFDEFYRALPASDRARIVDLGAVSHADKVRALRLADVLVLPSRFEAFGIVILEAWACGTPVIVSASGAMPSIVGEGGLAFPHGDAAALAQQLERLLADPDEARAMARRGYERLLDRYTWDKIAAAVQRTYRPLVMSARRRRVLIASNLFPPFTSGGAEIVAHREARLLTEMGAEVEVFCGHLDGDADRRHRVRTRRGRIRQTRVSLALADISGEWWNFRDAAIRRRFAEVLDRFAPDVVHFHNLVGLSVGLIDECAARGIPTVLTLHDYWGICFKNTMLKNDGALCARGGFDCLACQPTLMGESSTPSPVRNAHVLLSLRKVDRLVSPSRHLAQRYADNGLPLDRIAVLPNGIDLARFHPGARDRARRDGDVFTLGFIGYLGRHKGLDVLLRAVALARQRRAVQLLVAGDGEERDRFRELARELGLDGIVTFLGQVDNRHIAGTYARLDALAVPSVWAENSPVTITEAMANGLPVIASDVGGVGELVEHGVTGLLVAPRDVRGLAEAIERLAGDADLREAMGASALKAIRRHDAREQVARLAELFDALALEPRAPFDRHADVDVVVYAARRSADGPVRLLVDRLARVQARSARRILLCRMDLCDEDTLDAAKALVVPDADADELLWALQAMRRSVPVLASQSAEEAAAACQLAEAGLVYADGDELEASLELLLGDEALRRALGERGRRFLAEEAARVPTPAGRAGEIGAPGA